MLTKRLCQKKEGREIKIDPRNSTSNSQQIYQQAEFRTTFDFCRQQAASWEWEFSTTYRLQTRAERANRRSTNMLFTVLEGRVVLCDNRGVIHIGRAAQSPAGYSNAEESRCGWEPHRRRFLRHAMTPVLQGNRGETHRLTSEHTTLPDYFLVEQ